VLIVTLKPNEKIVLLSLNGFVRATATDGADALEYLATYDRPDVVLLNMAMPWCDGPETLRRIRADDRLAGMRVFSTSSTSPRELSVPDGPGGFDAWFPKPLDPRRLWSAIQAAASSTAAAN
jgi:CheY-like chemotaxis protein